MTSYTLQSHSRPIKRVRFNRDGDMFFSCSDDKSICAWTKEMDLLGVYTGPTACKSIAVSYNTEYLVGAFVTEGFVLFDVMTGVQLHHFPQGGDRVINVEFNYGDTELAVVFQCTGKSMVKVYDFKKLIGGE